MQTQVTSPEATYQASHSSVYRFVFTFMKSHSSKQRETLKRNHKKFTVIIVQIYLCAVFHSFLKQYYYSADLCERSDRHVVWSLRIISMLLPMSERHAFSLRPHWISCTSAKCYFSEDQFAYKSFLLVWLSTANWTGLVRMVRGCHHHCGDRRKHTLAYAG